MTHLSSFHRFALVDTKKAIDITTFEGYRTLLEWAIMRHIQEHGLGRTQDLFRQTVDLAIAQSGYTGRENGMFGDWTVEEDLDDDMDTPSQIGLGG